MVWDSATGKQVAKFSYPRSQNMEECTIQWFGPDYVIVRGGGGWGGGVWSATTGEQLGSIGTRFVPGSPDDQLWAHMGKNGGVGFSSPEPKFLFHAPVPPVLPKSLEFTVAGYVGVLPAR